MNKPTSLAYLALGRGLVTGEPGELGQLDTDERLVDRSSMRAHAYSSAASIALRDTMPSVRSRTRA